MSEAKNAGEAKKATTIGGAAAEGPRYTGRQLPPGYVLIRKVRGIRSGLNGFLGHVEMDLLYSVDVQTAVRIASSPQSEFAPADDEDRAAIVAAIEAEKRAGVEPAK